MTDALLLDTCAVIWTANGDPVNDDAVDAMGNAYREGRPLHVSPISAWEIGLLVARGRLSIATRPEAWFDRLLATPGVASAPMPEALLIQSSFLPGMPPADPADRIVIATAREYDMRVVTRDHRILAYAEDGHVKALEC